MKNARRCGWVMLVAAWAVRAHAADLTLKDAGDHLIDYVIDGSLYVWPGPEGEGTTATLLPGSLVTGSVTVEENSYAWLEGGEVAGAATARGDGGINMSAGVVGGDLIAGGDNGVVLLSGGIVGGDFVTQGGPFVIDGMDFLFDGQAVGTITLSGIDGMLSGVLADGTHFEKRAYDVFGDGRFILRVVPEPSAGLLGGFALAYLAWLGWRRQVGF